MPSLALVNLVFWFGLALPAALHPQSPPQQPPPSKPTGAQPPAKPQDPPQTPAPETPAQAPAETARSLFEPTWQQFEIGGRFSSVSGDPARFQRYEDIRDGILFTDARYARE